MEAGGRQTFEWKTAFEAEPGHGFEMVFWRPGDDAMSQGFGLTSPTQSASVQVNLDDLDRSLGNMLDSGEYMWGVLYVRTEPSYQRIALFSQKEGFGLVTLEQVVRVIPVALAQAQESDKPYSRNRIVIE